MKYLICLNGKRISVKRSDRNNDFGTILGDRDTHSAAMRLATIVRHRREHFDDDGDLFTQRQGGKVK